MEAIAMLSLILIVFATALLAYSNGANDNIKGVATLIGTGKVSFRTALTWANICTFAGACTAVFLFRELAGTFSGQGIRTQDVTTSPDFLATVGMAAGITVLLATRFGLPVSTTHALVGAIAGAGLAAAPASFSLLALSQKFVLPLTVSPFLAFVGVLFLYPVLRSSRRFIGIDDSSCLCIGRTKRTVVPSLAMTNGPSLSSYTGSVPISITGKYETCAREFLTSLLSIDQQNTLRFFHFLSSGAVCFARGLNDAPKIMSLALVGTILPAPVLLVSIGGLMVIGAVLQARRVAETMSYKITNMNEGQAFPANLTAAVLVIFASRAGVPVSTTHVTCGALFRIGLLTGEARWKSIGQILAAWVVTVPLAAAAALLLSLLI